MQSEETESKTNQARAVEGPHPDIARFLQRDADGQGENIDVGHALPPDLVPRRPGEWAAIDIHSLKIAAGGGAGAQADVTARLRFISPDDGNADDRTVVELPLDSPVGPGDSIQVSIAWTSHVPRTFARTGAVGDSFFLAQWFPKIGVFQESGWNCHQFHAGTEFFSDFGAYDVNLTVPWGWIVGATGSRVGIRDTQPGGWQTHQYAKTTCTTSRGRRARDYVERRARFEHPTLPAVEMRLLLQPEHAGQEQRHFDATRAALKYYGEWYGPTRTAISPLSIPHGRAAPAAWSTQPCSRQARAGSRRRA